MKPNNNIEYGKLPPQNLDLEEAVLGAIILENNALLKISSIIRPETFYKDEHKIIYQCIQSLFEQSKQIDLAILVFELKKTGKLAEIGGHYKIVQLTNHVASSANIESHARILYELYLKREMIRLSSDVLNKAYDDTSDAFDIITDLETSLTNINEGGTTTITGQQGLLEMLTHMDKVIKNRNNNEPVDGVNSGFKSIDRVISGFGNTNLIIVAGRPGMGKTAFILNAINNIIKNDKCVIYSYEMSALQLMKRLTAINTGIPHNLIRDVDLTDFNIKKVSTDMGNIQLGNLLINQDVLNIYDICANITYLKMKHDIKIVFIDYIQLVKEIKGNIIREQQLSKMSGMLKQTAKKLNIPIVALSQLSREVEKRGGNKRPMLSDLRESGAIEQDADQVLFLYRPEYYNIHEDEDGMSTKGIAEIITAKNRHGATDNIKLKFIDYIMKFEDLDENNEITIREDKPF